MSTQIAPLTERDYRRIRRATRTYREELIVRLAGEVGLRPAEMTRLTMVDVEARDVDGDRHFLLRVSGSTGERFAYLPRDVHDDLRKFAGERGRADDDPVLDVSTRRIQMLVAEIGERVDRPVSSRALRRFFARRLLTTRDVNPRIVAAAGGWSSLDTLGDLFPDPDETSIVRALGDASRLDRPAGPVGRGEPRFDATVEAVQAIGRELGTARSREEVESIVCEVAVDRGPYAAAWIADAGEGDRDPAARAWEGLAADGVDAVLARLDGATDPAADGGQPIAVRRLRVPIGERPGRYAVGVVPIVHGETTYGSLGLATDDPQAFGPRERGVVLDLGRRLGQAVATVSQRRLLRADSVVELDFRSGDPDSFVLRMARACECSFELAGLVPGAGGSLVLYFRVTGSAPERVVDAAADAEAVSRVRLVRSRAGEAVVELNVAGESLPVMLTEYGGYVTAFDVEETVATITAEFPTDVDVRSVVQGVTAVFPGTEFVAKREAAHPVSTPGDVRSAYDADLTEKQRSVLHAAFLAGYFDWPRGTTAEELADSLGISSPTLHNHLRKAQRSLLAELFGDGDD